MAELEAVDVRDDVAELQGWDSQLPVCGTAVPRRRWAAGAAAGAASGGFVG